MNAVERLNSMLALCGQSFGGRSKEASKREVCPAPTDRRRDRVVVNLACSGERVQSTERVDAADLELWAAAAL